MSIPGLELVGVLLVAVLVLSVGGNDSDACVTTFYEFEKAAINDSPGNVEALVTAFYETNKPVPLSVQVVFHVNSSTGIDNDTFISTDSSCHPGKEMWLWVPSPVFLFMEPTKLNLCALFTLNYFSHWNPTQAHIYVPEICNISHNQFNFLNDLTSRVQIYAAAHLYGKDINPGYVLRGCGDKALTTLLPTTLKNNGQSLQNLSQALIGTYLVGCLFLIVEVILVIWLILFEIKDDLTNNGPDQEPSINNYGLFWAGVVLSVLGNGVLIAHTIVIVEIYVHSSAIYLIVVGWIIVALLAIGVIASLIVAIQFSKKLDLSIPSIFLHPLVILSCNRAVKRCQKIIQFFSLWSLLLFILQVVGRVGIIALAVLASPPTVLFTLLIYLVAAVCTVQFLAVLFTFCKMKKNSNQWHFCSLVCQTAAFTCLFVAILCFSVMISAIGALADYGTVKSSLYSVFSIFIVSIAPTAFVWALHTIGRKWLEVHGHESVLHAPDKNNTHPAPKTDN